jgi:hypothetical protein
MQLSGKVALITGAVVYFLCFWKSENVEVPSGEMIPNPSIVAIPIPSSGL